MSSKYQYQVGVDLKTQLEKTGITQLLASLKEVERVAARALKFDTATPELKKASAAAKELQGILHKAYDPRLGTTNLSTFRAELSKSGKTLGQYEKTLSSAGTSGIRAFNNLASATFNTNRGLKTSNELLSKMGTTMANTLRWSVSASILQGFSGSVQQAYGYVKDLDTALNDIRIVTNKSADEMEKFSKSANKAAQVLGTSTKDYTQAALIFYQQGLGDTESKARADLTIKASKVTGQEAGETSEQLTAVWNGYKMGAEEAALAVDKLAAVAAASASDLEEQSKAMSKVASAASSMGVDMDQLNSMIATTVSVTRQAPESIGTAYKTIFARLGDLKVDGVDEFGVKLGDVSSKLKQMGIEVLDQEGNLRDMGSVVEEVGSKWGTWTEAQRAAAAQAMAGKRQYNNLIALFDNWDMYNEQLSISQNSLGTLDQQHNIYLDSVAGKTEQLRAKTERLYSAMFNTEDISTFIDLGGGLVDVLSNFIESIGGGSEALMGFGALAVSIFRKQIGSAVGDSILNLKRFSLQSQQLIDQKHLLLSLDNYEIGVDQGTEKESRMLAILKEMAPYWDNMSQESRETALNLAESAGELQIQKEALMSQGASILARAKRNVGIKNTAFTVNHESGRLSYSKTSGKEHDRAIKLGEKLGQSFTTEKDKKKVSNLINELKQFTPTTRKAKDEFDKFVAAFEKGDLTDTAFTSSQKQLAKIIGKDVPKAIKEAQAEIDKYNADLAEINQQDDKYGQEAALFAERERLAQTMTSITSVIGGIGQLAFAWQSFQSLGALWADEDLSTGDKILQTFMNLGMTLPMVIGSVIEISKATETLAKARKGLQAVTTGETIGELANAGAKEAGLLVSAKAAVQASILEGKEITLTAALWAQIAARLGLTTATLGAVAGLAALAAVVGVTAVVMGHQAKATKEASLATQEYSQRLVDSNTAAKEELDTFKALAEQYKKTKEGKKELVAAADALSDRFAIQKLAIDDVNSGLDTYISRLDEAFNKSKAKEVSFQTRAIFSALGAKMPTPKTNKGSGIVQASGINVAETFGKDNSNITTSDEDSKDASARAKLEEFQEYRRKFAELEKEEKELTKKLDNVALSEDDVTKIENQLIELGMQKTKMQEEAPEDYAKVINEMIPQLIASQGELQANIMAKKSFTGLSAEEYEAQLQETIDQIIEDSDELLTPEEAAQIAESAIAQSSPEGRRLVEGSEFMDKFSSKQAAQKALDEVKKLAPGASHSEQMQLLMGAIVDPSSKEDIKKGIDDLREQVKNGKQLELEVKIKNAQEAVTSAKTVIEKLRTGADLTDEEKSTYADDAKADTKDPAVQAKIVAKTLEEARALRVLADASKDSAEKERLHADARQLVNSSLETLGNIAQRSLDDVEKLKKELKDIEITQGKGSSAALAAQDRLTAAQKRSKEAMRQYKEEVYKTRLEQEGFSTAIATSAAATMAQGEAHAKLKLKDLGAQFNALKGDIDKVTASTWEDILATHALGATAAAFQARSERDFTDWEENPAKMTRLLLQSVMSQINEEMSALKFSLTLPSVNIKPSSAASKSDSKSDSGSDLPEKIDLINAEADAYYGVALRIARVTANLEKLKAAQDKLNGKALIKNLEAQIKLLQKLMSEEKTRVKTAEQERRNAARTLETITKNAVTFNANNEISNYARIIQNKEDKVNDLIKKYNKAKSDKTKKSLKEQIDKAREELEALQAAVEAYDETLAALEEANARIRDLLLETVELNIEKFNIKINLSLDFKEAAQSWNEFKATVIDNKDMEDSIDLIQTKVKDFSTYINKNKTGTIDIARANFNTLDAEVKKMIAGKGSARFGTDSMYKDLATMQAGGTTAYGKGADGIAAVKAAIAAQVEVAKAERQAAFDILQENMQEYYDLIKQIEEAQIAWAENTAAKFEKINTQYEALSSTLQYQANVIKLLYGEDSYSDMAKYYKAQAQNNVNQIRNQKASLDILHKAQDALGRRTEANAKTWDALQEQISTSQTALEEMISSSLENLVARYKNIVAEIFASIESTLTGGLTVADAGEEWKLLNQGANIYLDTITSAYQVDKLRSTTRQQIDDIANISAKEKLNKALEQELTLLAAKDKLTQYDLDRANARLDVELKRIALEESQNRKTSMRLTRNASGGYSFAYVKDAKLEKKAVQDLADAKQKVYELDRKNFADSQTNYQQTLQAYMAAAQEIAMDQTLNSDERSEKQAELDSRYKTILDGQSEVNATARANYLETTMQRVKEMYGEDSAQYKAFLKDKDAAMSTWDINWTSTTQGMIDKISGSGGFTELAENMWTKVNRAAQQFETNAATVAKSAGESFENMTTQIDDTSDASKALTSATSELVGDLKNEVTALEKSMSALKAYKDTLSDVAEEAAEAWSTVGNSQLAAIGAAQGAPVSNPGSSYISEAGAGGSNNGAAPPASNPGDPGDPGDSDSFYPKYTGKSGSIVDALKALNINSSYANREKIAKANGISNYSGTAAQNTKLLNLLKKGKLKKPGGSSGPSAAGSFYSKYTGNSSSIVDALTAIGANSSYASREKIAKANDISNYKGTASQNTALLNLLKQGKLKRTEGSGGSTTGEAGDIASQVAQAKKFAESKLGKNNYLYGGNGPKYDCSGYVYAILKNAGMISKNSSRFTTSTFQTNKDITSGKGKKVTIGWKSGHMGVQIDGTWYQAANSKKGIIKGGSNWTKYYHPKGFDTGGYTGDWGGDKSGKMAFLHEKEIVLNKADTANLLSTVSIVRDLAASLQGSGVSLNAIPTPTSGTLKQQVTIDASFPSVTNSNEVEKALKNLINTASQYANRGNKF